MSIDGGDYKLRFHAGKFEEQLLSLIQIVQLTFETMLGLVSMDTPDRRLLSQSQGSHVLPGIAVSPDRDDGGPVPPQSLLRVAAGASRPEP